MGYAIVERVVWQNQWKPSLVVVLDNGPVYNLAHDVRRGRHAQFLATQEVTIHSRNWQTYPNSAVGYDTDVLHNLYSRVFVEYQTFDNPWRPAPRLITDFIQNSDLFVGSDTYGWPPEGPEPPRWVNEQRGTFNILQNYIAYNYANDVFLLRPQSKVFQEPQVYWTPQQPIGVWGTTYLPYTDVRFQQQTKVFAPEPGWWDFKQPLTANVLNYFPVYNPATDVTQLRPQAKIFVEPGVYWTPQQITINALTFTPPPYNPATDVRFPQKVSFISEISLFDNPLRYNPVIVNTPQVTPPTPPTSFILTNWGGRVVLSPKKLGEDIFVPMDFISRLAAGETIVSAFVTCSVYSGVDSAPQSMVDGPATISGTVVEQFIVGGVLGTIYELLFTANTSLSQVIELSGYFVVEPDLP